MRFEPTHIITALIVLGIGYLMTTKDTVRGLRNNNPLNIKEEQWNDIEWEGEHELDLDPTFEEFQTPLYGLRAGARILRTYANKHGRKTIGRIIERWAPTNENDTANYINFVVDYTGIPANRLLTRDEYPHVMAAMIHMENGEQPFPLETIKQGFEWGFYG